MKILAIRGQNLASLDGEFLVDFTAPNFSQNGLIAIVGSTGAGKSTLLDALCLALFNKIPRLPSRGTKTLVGRADEDSKLRLASHDVRHILRRGTGEGYAEVDFLGADNKKYRARWSVHRARNRPSDPFQKSGHRLIRLSDEQLIGRTPTDVRQEIENKLGLSFDQFRRSVLLAQGDFASFLKADVAARSRLLEIITGTEIYGEISRQSHLRVKEESTKLQQLQTRLAEYDTLDNDARQQLEDDLANQKTQWETQQANLMSFQKKDEQLKQLSNLKARVQQTHQDYAKQQQCWQDTHAARDTLQQTKQLQTLRLPLQRFDDAQSQQEKIQQQQQVNEQQLQTSQALLKQLSNVCHSQETRYLQSKNTLQQAQPILREAYRLDEQIRRTKEEWKQRKAQQKTHEKDLSDLQKVTQSHQSAWQTSQQQSDKLAIWLQQHQTDEKLSSQWTYWEKLFDDLIHNQQEQKKNQSQLATLKQEREISLKQYKQSQHAVDASNQQLTTHIQTLETLDKQQNQADLDKNIADIQHLHVELNQLKELEKQQQDATQHQQQQTQLQQELDELQIATQKQEQQKQKYQSELVIQDARLNEAVQTHNRALLATGQSAEQLRSQLSENKPCSVCGSTSHPWQGNTQLQALADQQDQRVRELQSENSVLKKQLQQTESEIRFNSKQHAKQTENLVRIEVRIQEIKQQWSSLSTQAMEDFQAKESITQQQSRLDQKQQSQKQLQQQRDHIEQTFKEKESCLKQLSQQQNTLQSIEKQQQKLTTSCEHVATQITQLKGAEETTRYDLAPAIASAEGSSDEISEMKQYCQQRAEKYQQQHKERDQLTQQINQHKQTFEKQSITMIHAKESLQKEQQAALQAQQQNDTLTETRQKLFTEYSGTHTENIEQTLTNKLEQTKADFDNTQQEQQAQKENVLSKEAALAELKSRHNEQSQLLQRYHQDLQQALASFDIDEAQAREHLVKDNHWIHQQEQEFQQLNKQRQHQQTLWETAAQTLQAYEKEANNLSINDSLEELQQQIDQCKQAIATTEAQLGELQFRRRDDDNKRKQANKLQKDYDKQEQTTHVWKVMKELIGSEDGSKFRNFAQSLTLEILLAHTNQRLQELNRRYALQRIPQTDLELQIIDKEMGDEVRPIHSLSGGESFLVSLGLALGLASLTSRKTQIDSLFIDEGFGTLDPQTLDTALSALDSLQSQGKTVCIISHVSAITERVAAQVRVNTCGNGKSVVEVC